MSKFVNGTVSNLTSVTPAITYNYQGVNKIKKGCGAMDRVEVKNGFSHDECDEPVIAKTMKKPDVVATTGMEHDADDEWF